MCTAEGRVGGGCKLSARLRRNQRAPGMARSDRRGADNAELVNKKPAAKVSREVTWRCKSSGDPGDREPLAKQQLRRREAGWGGSCIANLWSEEHELHVRQASVGKDALITEALLVIRAGECICSRCMERKSRAFPRENCNFASC